MSEGILALLVLPDGDSADVQSYRRLVAGSPIVTTPRRKNPLLLISPRTPYVVSSRPAPTDLVGRVRALAPDATGIVLFSYKSRAIGEALARGLQLPLILRQHNREGAYHHSLAEQTPGPRGWVLRAEAHRISRDEARLAHADWITGTADISAADAQWRRSIGTPNVEHIPPFAASERFARPADGAAAGPVDGAAEAPSVVQDGAGSATGNAENPPDKGGSGDGGPPRVLFLGTLDTATNVGALTWFLDGAWPRIIAKHPDVVLDVVGRSPSPALRRRLEETPRVELAADVPQIDPYLRRADVAINPVVSGSGVNIKVIEYLEAEVPLVSTSLAVRGLPLRPGVDLEVHDEPNGFADAVLALLADPRVAREMARSGREQLVELLDPARNLRRVAAMMHS